VKRQKSKVQVLVLALAALPLVLHAQAGRGRAANGSETTQIAGLRVSIWRPAAAHGRAPLVIFSHGFHGTSTQSTFLMKALAADGYLVVAPNHKDAIGGGHLSEPPEAGFGRPDTWTDRTFRDRADDVRNLIAALKADQQWNAAIDWSRFALAGHSLGGYTVLGLAGGWASWQLPEVRAVVALSPYASPFIQKKALGAITAPVMYQGGTRDIGITPTLRKPGGAYDQTPAPALFVEFRGAGHFAWTDLEALFQPSINAYALAFLDRYVKGDRAADFSTKRADVIDLRSK
jgi:predicted dienelactone hydrolase